MRDFVSHDVVGGGLVFGGVGDRAEDVPQRVEADALPPGDRRSDTRRRLPNSLTSRPVTSLYLAHVRGDNSPASILSFLVVRMAFATSLSVRASGLVSGPGLGMMKAFHGDFARPNDIPG